MCQTTGQRDIYDMHGSPFDKNTAERGVEVWKDQFSFMFAGCNYHVAIGLTVLCDRTVKLVVSVEKVKSVTFFLFFNIMKYVCV